MSLRVAAWNMCHWQMKGHAAEAWRYLSDVVAPDVALVQEAVPPPGAAAICRQGGISTRRPWGSAVVSNNPMKEVTHAKTQPSAEPAPLLGTVPGSVAIALVDLPGGEVLTAISAYGVIEFGYADTTVNHILSDLTPLMDDPRLNKYVVLGGDLNITTQWSGSNAKYATLEAVTFDRFRALGLIDCVDKAIPPGRGRLEDCPCLLGDACRHVRTQRHKRSTVPWENDYLFASTALAERLVSAEVWDRPEVWELSDHAPVVGMFDV